MTESSLRKSDGTFAPGWRGGGRPKGSRARITELALRALGEDFAIHGPAVIEEVRKAKPAAYLAIIASLLPKQVEKLESPFVDLSDSELDQLEQMLAGLRARTVTDLGLESTDEPQEK